MHIYQGGLKQSKKPFRYANSIHDPLVVGNLLVNFALFKLLGSDVHSRNLRLITHENQIQDLNQGSRSRLLWAGHFAKMEAAIVTIDKFCLWHVMRASQPYYYVLIEFDSQGVWKIPASFGQVMAYRSLMYHCAGKTVEFHQPLEGAGTRCGRSVTQMAAQQMESPNGTLVKGKTKTCVSLAD